MAEPKVIHESKSARYVVQWRYGTDTTEKDWNDYKSFHSRDDAIKWSDKHQLDEPQDDYRVIDTAVDKSVVD